MYRLIGSFVPYITKSDGIRIPKKNYTIIIHSEDNVPLETILPKLNIPRFMVRNVGFIKKTTVVGRPVIVTRGLLRDVAELKYTILPIDQLDKLSYSYFVYLNHYTTILKIRYSGLVLYRKTLNFLDNIYSQIVPKDNFDVLLLVKDKSANTYFPLAKVLLYALRKKLDFPFKKVFFVSVSDNAKPRYTLIYDAKYAEKKNYYSKLKSFIQKNYKIEIDENEFEDVSQETPIQKKDLKVSKSILKPTTNENDLVDYIVSVTKDLNVVSKPEDLKIIEASIRKTISENPALATKIDFTDKSDILYMVKSSLLTYALNSDELKEVYISNQDIQKLVDLLNSQIQEIEKRPIRLRLHSNDVINNEKAIDSIVNKQKLTVDISLSKREIERRLTEKWLFQIGNTLNSKDVPLQLDKVEIIDTQPDKFEVGESKFEYWQYTYKTPTGRKMTVRLKVPKLEENRYVVLGGVKGYNPFIQARLPIFTLKPGIVVISTSYATVTVFVKPKTNTTWIKISGYQFPLVYLFLLDRSLPDLLKLLSVKNYEIVDSKSDISKCSNTYTLKNGKILCIKQAINDQVNAILTGLNYTRMKSTKVDPISIDYGRSIISNTFGDKSIYQILTVMDNLIDPLSQSILIMRGLPSKFIPLMFYANELAVKNIVFDKLAVPYIRLRQQDVLIEMAYKVLHKAYSKYRYDVLSNVKNPKLDVNENELINFLRLNGVLDILEQQNPVEELSALMKVKLVGPGGLPSKEALTFSDRSLRESYFGTFDPVDTSEGDPGAYQHLTVSALNSSVVGFLGTKKLSDSEKKIFGIAASLVPFVEKDDGNRVLMACNQMKQALPITNAEAPVVQTGMESIIPSLLSSSHVIRSKDDGVVLYVDDEMIVLKYKDGTTEKVDLTPHELFGMVSLRAASVKHPIVNVGDKVKKDQIIAKNTMISDDLQLAQGVNVRVAFMPYEGMNFEDGICISESFANSMKSLHYETFNVRLSNSRILNSLLSIGESFKKGDVIASVSGKYAFDSFDIIAKFDGKVVDYEVYPNTKLDRQKVLLEKIHEKDLLLKQKNNVLKKYGVNDKYELESDKLKHIGEFKIKGEVFDGILLKIKVLYIKSTEVGDKLHNRHGNKGVICKIYPDSEAPITPEGDKIDVIFSPLGVIGRMNMGQVYELYVGRAMDVLTKKVIENSDNRAKVEKLISDVYTILDSTEDKSYSKAVINNFKSMNGAAYKRFIDRLKSGKRLNLVVKQFGKFNYDNLKKVFEYLKIDFREKLYLPKYDVYTKEPVAIGVMFIEKLEHITSAKEAVRSIGRYDPLVEQAVAGRKRGGGQRIGEMDTWVYLEYEADKVIIDLFNVSGDNPEVKQQVLASIIQSGKAHLSDIKSLTGSRKALNSYLAAMGVLDLKYL